MADQIKVGEGPWTDEDSRLCLGIWGDEGDYLLELRREVHGISFHIVEQTTGEQHAITISDFRLRRILNFINPGLEKQQAIRKEMEDIIRGFVARVEAGEVHSRRTYQQMKTVLEKIDADK